MHQPCMIPLLRRILAAAACLPCLCGAAEDIVFRFPTDNHALTEGRNSDFYMYCDRNFEQKKSQPWEAGGYGMVRGPFRASDGSVMFSHLHEGIDIKPLRRDASGEPLDEVRPVAPGWVVYTSSQPGMSNYGRYVVVAHRAPEGYIFSLYAHLAKVNCQVGQRVGTANVLGIMGHSGVGLNRVRSHLHLELCLMIHSKYDQFCPKENKHGKYNGQNLVGFDAAPALLACKDGEPLSLSAHWSSLKEHYRVRVPYDGKPVDILQRHPFLRKGDWSKTPVALDWAFTAEGVPLGVWASHEKVSEPTVIRCTPQPTYQQNVTVNRVKNSSKDAKLTASGLRYVNQFMWQKPASTTPGQP